MVKVVVKKWGNSLGVILPADLVKDNDLHPNDTIEIVVERKVKPISDLFGSYKQNGSTQQIKDGMRRGWDD